MRQASTQVAIVGAGPVGLLLACELRRAGVQVVMVERLASPMTESRASQLSSLTAELLHERGFDSLLDQAGHEPTAHFGGLPFNLADLDSKYAGYWKIPQHRTESILAQRAERLGATLLRAHALTGITELVDHVICEVRGPTGELRIRAQYVVGCDGARSTVRRLGGFTSSATGATKEMLRADVTGIEIRDRRFERLEPGLAVAGTRDGVTRIMVYAAGQGMIKRTAPPRFPEIARLWNLVTGEDISGGNASWIDSFDNAMGQADCYRRGRILLAGDAAHWHMPIGGQALNVGLQDAVNLGWKLAGAVDGWATPGLLDSYEAERHPVAARVLGYVAAQEIVLLGGSDIESLRSVLSELIGLDQVRRHLARVVSGLDDRYGPRESALAGSRIANVALRGESGSAMTADLLAGIKPTIVRLTPRADGTRKTPAPFGGIPVRTIHAISDDDSFRGITTILLRPDGYVAWAGDDEEELSLKIGQWFRVSSAQSDATFSNKALPHEEMSERQANGTFRYGRAYCRGWPHGTHARGRASPGRSENCRRGPAHRTG